MSIDEQSRRFDTLEKRTEKLDDRLRYAERYFHAGIVLAFVFGISGGWGYSLINKTKTEIDSLQLKVANVDATISSGINKIQNQEDSSIASIIMATPQILTHALDSVLVHDSSRKYIRIGDLQICWDSKIIMSDPKLTKEHLLDFSFTFPVDFVRNPNLTISTETEDVQGEPRVGCSYSVYWHTLTTRGYTGGVIQNNNQIANKVKTISDYECSEVPVRVSYLAIGKWQ